MEFIGDSVYMHRQLRKLLEEATGISQHVIAIVLDIRGFTLFCQSVDSLDVATYIKKVYVKIIDNYFSNASFYKPTGDGLLVIIPYDEESLREVLNNTIESCLNLLRDFGNLCDAEPMINFDTPNKIGIGLTRGSACCISSGEVTLDYSGKVLNLASRLMDVARPSGIVFDSGFGPDLLLDGKKELFLEEDVYIRGVAEEEPITVYYSKEYTLIPDIYKKPIREPKWENEQFALLFKELKRQGSKAEAFSLTLKSKPLDENQIFIRIEFSSTEGYEKFYDRDITYEDVDYVVKGKKHYIKLKSESVVELLESAGVTDETEIKFDVDYPTR